MAVGPANGNGSVASGRARVPEPNLTANQPRKSAVGNGSARAKDPDPRPIGDEVPMGLRSAASPDPGTTFGGGGEEFQLCSRIKGYARHLGKLVVDLYRTEIDNLVEFYQNTNLVLYVNKTGSRLLTL